MSLAKRGRREQPATVPHWPEQCCVAGCEEPTAVALLSVIGPGGPKVVIPGTVLAAWDHDGGQLQPGYTFSGWITRCAGCFLSDRDRKQAGRPAEKHRGSSGEPAEDAF